MRQFFWVGLALSICMIVYLLLCGKAFGQEQANYGHLVMNGNPQVARAQSLTSDGGTVTASGEGHAQIPTPPEESLGDAVKRLKLHSKKTPLECQNAMHRACICR